MTDNRRVNRRDFIKISALASMALPTAQVVGSVGGMEVIESPGEYGGFYIRKHKLGDPPYTVDDKVLRRPDFVTNVKKMFGYIENPFLFNQNKEKHIKNNDPGFTRLDYAFEDAAVTLAATGGNSMMGCKGFQSWEPLEREDLLTAIQPCVEKSLKNSWLKKYPPKKS